MYIILAAILIAIAAYYPIKLIKFYCMESEEQGLKAKITQDLREGKVSRNLILLVLGEGGLRLTRNKLDYIFEWMVQNTNSWRVHTYTNGKTVVMFSRTPPRPEEWDDYEDYKRVIRLMFGDRGTVDFLASHTTMEESDHIFRDFTDIDRQIKLYDYVTFDFNGVGTLGMVVGGGLIDGIYTVKILSGESRGQYRTVGGGDNVSKLEPDEAVKELSRQKEEWKTKKREEFREKYGNILRGSYLKAPSVNSPSLYIVESVDIDEAKATAIRLIDLGLNFHAGEKCILPLQNGFVLVSPEDAAEILLKEYSNE